VEQRCTLVVNEVQNNATRLTGFEQALWHSLALGSGYEATVQMLSNMAKLDFDTAEREFRAILREWCTLGLVEIEEVGQS
jgi:hypothetical protein